MKYTYIPNSYNPELVDSLFSEDEFVELQKKYRQVLEQIIRKVVDFKQIDKKIKKVLQVPIIEDTDTNFYHKFSSLQSDYIFLRNNIHIENLSSEELQQLKTAEIGDDFIFKTLSKVIFEEGDEAFYGVPVLKNAANCKGLVFEFAYDQMQLLEVKELQIIRSMINEITAYLKKVLQTSFPYPVSVITYNGIPNLFEQEQKEEKVILN